MKNILKRLRLDLKTTLLLVSLLLIAAFFRFYRFYEFVTFLGDQGRDAHIMRQIVTLKDFPALGPITSVGSIYLGPLYYYFMSPWLFLTHFNPVGPAIGVAVLALISLVLQYFAVRDMIDSKTALISTVFSVFSWTLVEYSRFSWNPNLLPYVSFFFVYSTYKAVQTHKTKYFFLVGTLFSFAIQLHYLAVLLAPFAATAIMTDVYRLMKSPRSKTLKNQNIQSVLTQYLKHLGFGLVGFVIPLAPFLVFELIHHFPNLNSIVNFTHQPELTKGYPYHIEVQDTFRNIVQFSFQAAIQNWLVIILLALFVLFFISELVLGHSLSYILGALIIVTLGTALYKGPKFVHYLGASYVLIYVTTAYMLGLLITKLRKVGIIFTLLILALFIKVNVQHYYFLFEKNPPNEIYRAEKVTNTILSMHPQQPYALTTIPESYSDNVYRYYLGVANQLPITKEEDNNIPTKNLFVICEGVCDPMGDPQWTIAHFAAKKVEEERIVPEVTSIHVYKLIK